jgi:hypothetical protein
LAGCPLNDAYFIEANASEAGPTGGAGGVGGAGAGGIGGAGGVGGAGAPGADARSDARLDATSDAVDEDGPQSIELAQNKPAIASSEQTSRGNLAPRGNDGSAFTRWSAAGPETPTWWRVDLGAPHWLSRIEIDWEFARPYGYLIEISDDDVTYVTAVDRSLSSDATQNQSAVMSISARYVRVTVTAVIAFPITYPGFWEVRVFGT